jgi:hypothetical protein
MPDGAIETVTIAEAAALLGVHRNAAAIPEVLIVRLRRWWRRVTDG